MYAGRSISRSFTDTCVCTLTYTDVCRRTRSHDNNNYYYAFSAWEEIIQVCHPLMFVQGPLGCTVSSVYIGYKCIQNSAPLTLLH